MKRQTLFGEIDVQTDVAPDNWMTPHELYPEGCFDPCPVDADFDGLKIDWHGHVFINPPYSDIEMWVEKAITESQYDRVLSLTMLLPNWTDRRWFQKIKHLPIEFITGRVKFLHPKTGLPVGTPPWGCMLVKIK